MKTALSYTLRLLALGGILLMAGCQPKPEEPEPTEYTFSVSPKSLTLLLGETGKLHPTITPAYETSFTFRSDDPEIASVDKNGVVTANEDSTGSTTITVSATINGETYKKRCIVDVVEDKLMLNKDQLSLFLGNSEQLTVSYSRSKTDVTEECTWSSENPEIATCEGGLVQSVAAGTTHLTATYEGLELTCTVQVFDNLAITPSETTLLIGATAQLTINIEDATLTSSDASVAQVSPTGLVTAIAKGTAVITAQYADQQATATVNVSDDLQILSDGQPITALAVTFSTQTQLSTNAPGLVEWNSSNPSVAKIDNTGLVTGLSLGSSTITAQYGVLSVSINVTVVKGDTYFYVSETQRVELAPGNLQYHIKDKKWRFAPHPWDICGSDNERVVDSNADCWIDLFVSGSGKDPTNYAPTWTKEPNPKVDWGVNEIQNGSKIDPANTWKSLNYSEWDYLLLGRPNASSLITTATVEGVTGLILLPSGWVTPWGITLKTELGTYSRNCFTAEEWAQLQAAGAVFLPSAGFRYREQYTPGIPSYRRAEYDSYYVFHYSEEEFLLKSYSGGIGGAYSVRLAKYIY